VRPERWDLCDTNTAKLVLPLYDIPSTKRQVTPTPYSATRRVASAGTVSVPGSPARGNRGNNQVDDFAKQSLDEEEGEVPLHKEVRTSESVSLLGW
jgi:hypothetical protein